MKRVLVSGLLAVALMAPSAAVLAAEPETRTPQELLREGVELRKAQRDREALDAFTRANQLAPSATARAQIGLARAALSDWLAADEDLRAALATDDAWIRKNHAQLEEVLSKVNERLGWIDVDVNVPRAERIVSGRALVDRRARVVAGWNHVVVRAEGYAPEERDVEVPAHAEVRVGVKLVPDEPHPAAAPAPGPAPVREVEPIPQSAPPEAMHDVPAAPSRAAPIALGAAGVVAIGVGAYFGVRAINDKSERDAHCQGLACTQAGIDAYDDGRRSATVSTIGFGLGIALVGASVAWLVLSHPQREPTPLTARAGTSPLFEVTRW